MYLDTDIILAQLKVDDWLAPVIEDARFDNPRTSVVTALEAQLVMFEIWSRPRLATVCDEIRDTGIELLPLTVEAFEAGAELLPQYPSLNSFDAVHIGHARNSGQPIVSTDTLYPKIDEIDHLDPRSL